MKILLTGGGTGGHFYPMIAVAEALRDIAKEKKFIDLDLIYVSDAPYNENLLKQEGIRFKKISSGKIRRYFSLLNISDFLKTLGGTFKAILYVYKEFPDVIFGKGGYASFPSLFAARILRIPVIIHESDSVPGKVNKWAGKFSKRVGISFNETYKYFLKEKTALIGNPIRRAVLGKTPEAGMEIFNLEPGIPTILILGGSQGSKKINEVILEIAKDLVGSFQVIHQCGKNKLKDVSGRLAVILRDSEFRSRYHLVDFLNSSQLRAASSVADLVISRSGANAIFEIAAWELPSILIPLSGSAQNHQEKNALNYAQTGAAGIVEEPNLTPHILLFEIQKILNDVEKREEMKKVAKDFAKIDAAKKIAEEIIKLALKHV